jgi:teichuronic acid biosynthesis glycosyltransferase TuaC
MRVLWTHNFDPSIANSGVFVHKTAAGVRARGVDLHLEYLGNLRSIRQVRRARNHVRRLAADFDLVHAQFGSACAFVTAAVEGVPKMVTLRGSDWNVHSASHGFLYFHTRAAAALTRWALPAYDCIIVVSHRLRRELARMYPTANVDVVPSPVDLARFVPRDKQQARNELGIGGAEEKWVLFNSLKLKNPIKRFELARQSFDLARAAQPNLRLRLATEMPHDAMPLFVAACDLLLCTSDNEGWPNSVKEALACNVPFVATDVSDLAEIAAIEPSCRICPPDAHAIASAIRDVLAGPPPTNLRRYVDGMSVEATADALCAKYRELLAKYSRTSGEVSSRAV